MKNTEVWIKLSHPIRTDFPVGIWRFPANKKISVTQTEYEQIKQAIETQKPSLYNMRTTLEVFDQ